MADVPWTGTGGISDTQSYPWIILNAIFDPLSTSSLFSAFVCKRIAAALQIDAGLQVPFLGVFSREAQNVADGELGAGDIRFISNFVIGVQIVLKNNDPAVMLAQLDRAYWFAVN